MILGTDHIALCSQNMPESGAGLERLGFRLKFLEKELLNHPEKKDFLYCYGSEHGMAFYESGGIGVELTSHIGAGKAAEKAGYRPLVDLPGDLLIKGKDTGEVVNSALGEYRSWFLKELGAFCLIKRQGASAKSAVVSGVELEVRDPAAAAEKWVNALGFTRNKASRDSVVLKKTAPVQRWCLNLLLRRGNARKWQLDSPGWPCLAFLSTDLEKDMARAVKCGWAENSNIFSLTVNHSKLSIALLRGDDNEIIELIAMKGAGTDEKNN